MFGTLPPASPPRLTCTTLCRVCTLRGTAAVVFADVCMCRLQGLWRVMHPGACSSVEHLQREGAYKYELTYRVWFIHTGFSQSCSVEWRELETGSERGVHGISIPLCIGGSAHFSVLLLNWQLYGPLVWHRKSITLMESVFDWQRRVGRRFCWLRARKCFWVSLNLIKIKKQKQFVVWFIGIPKGN